MIILIGKKGCSDMSQIYWGKRIKGYKFYFLKTELFDSKTESYNYNTFYYEVPIITVLNNKLYESHCNIFYYNKKGLIKAFKDNNIFFYGLTTLIKEYISNCPICVQTIKKGIE